MKTAISNSEIAKLIYEFEGIIYYMGLVPYHIFGCDILQEALCNMAFDGLKRYKRPDYIGGGTY